MGKIAERKKEKEPATLGIRVVCALP